MNSFEQSLPRLYSQEEAQQILSIALTQHYALKTELSYSQVLEIAEELQIHADTFKQAENKWINQQKEIKKRHEFDAYRQLKLQDRLGRYGIVNTCLLALNFLTGFSVPWSLYVLISWGIIRSLDVWRFFDRRQGYAYEQSFQSWDCKL